MIIKKQELKSKQIKDGKLNKTFLRIYSERKDLIIIIAMFMMLWFNRNAGKSKN